MPQLVEHSTGMNFLDAAQHALSYEYLNAIGDNHPFRVEAGSLSALAKPPKSCGLLLRLGNNSCNYFKILLTHFWQTFVQTLLREL